MRDPVEPGAGPQGLSRPWKAFLIALPVLLVVFFFLYGGAIGTALISAVIWAGVIATVVRVTGVLRQR
jgi:hypothetical protein